LDSIHRKVTQSIITTGENILQEGQEADARVQLLTQGVLDELDAEEKQVERAERTESSLERSDKEWKKLADHFKKTSRRAHIESQDQKDVEEMIEQFKQNIADMPDPPSLPKAEFEEAAKLKKVLARQFDTMKHDKLWEQKMWRLNTANVQVSCEAFALTPLQFSPREYRSEWIREVTEWIRERSQSV
jgi:vacuolar-type H+-ATPase subunit I/STV1